MADESMLTDEEILLLENLTYLTGPNGEKLVYAGYEDRTVGEFLNSIDTSEYIEDKDYGSYMTGEDWKDIIQAVENNDTLMDMKIVATNVDNTNDGGGGQSVVFVSEDKGEAVVAFRGTSDDEWKDNFIGGGPTDATDGVSTAHQENALEWYQDVYKQCGLDDYTVTLTGHSKGGNKAKYITLLDETVDRCVSFDGQGFSDEFMMVYADEIADRQNLIENHNVDYDFVNLLLNDVGNTTYYEGYAIGAGGFAENHCPNTFFNFGDNGEFTMTLAENGQAEEMIILDDFLNSYLRSMSAQDKEQSLDLVGTIVDGLLSGENPEFIIDLMLDEDNRESAAHLLAYMIKYEQENPEFADAVVNVLEEFDMADAAKIMDIVRSVMDWKYFDEVLSALGVATNYIPDFIWDKLADYIKDKTGIELSESELKELVSVLGMVSEDMENIEIQDGEDIKIITTPNQIIDNVINTIHSQMDFITGYFENFNIFSINLREINSAGEMIDKCCDVLDKAIKSTEAVLNMGEMKSEVKNIILNLIEQMKTEKTECKLLYDSLQQFVNIYTNTETSLVEMND